MTPSRLHADIRDATAARRRAPREPKQLHIAWNDDGTWDEQQTVEPVELTLEATDPEGQLAPWCHDLWWTCAVAQFADCPVALHIAPMPGALLNPVVLHELEMLERVAPQWRIIGHAYADDLETEEDIETVARSAYHEIRFVPHARRGGGRQCDKRDLQLEATIANIRRAQVRLGTDRPILVLLAETTTCAAQTGKRTIVDSTSAPARKA